MIIKKYECQKCHHKFTKTVSTIFIKGIMPKCSICGSEKIQSVDYIEKKKKK